MKITLNFLLLLLLGIAGSAFGQDKLLDRKGNEYLVKVLEITPDSIFYKDFPDSINVTTYVIPKAAVFMITYQNGVKDVFPEPVPVAQETQPAMTSIQLYNRGRADAINLYKGRVAFWGTYASTLVYPPVGLGVGAGMALTPPARHTFIASDPELLDNQDYVNGYTKQAKKQRVGKAAAGFGAGIGTYLAVFALLFSGVLF